jgi:hydroxylamine reductase (hybrid-cluster protein)
MQSLQETLLYGVKGRAAYANHARRLGKTDDEVSAFIEEALFATVTNVNFDLESLLELVLECGRINLRVMQLLDEGHTEKFGTPEPTTVYNDFSAVIEFAKQCDSLPEVKNGESTIGFHHSVILGLADKVVDAVKRGAIKHFFLIGGCDGDEIGRNYFSDYAHNAPDDTVILTLGCGKYRFRDHDYGSIAGIPRLLDMGQCNDAYGAIQVALALSKAFDCGVNDLPLTIVLSWFEQKAVAVLLTLLHLDVKGIRIGPAPPAFLSPNVVMILQEKFDLKLTGDQPLVDLQLALAYSAKHREQEPRMKHGLNTDRRIYCHWKHHIITIKTSRLRSKAIE